jgi:hypothetical protein
MNTFALATVLELEEQEKQLEEQVMRRLISQSIFPRQSYHTMSSADLHRRVMTSKKTNKRPRSMCPVQRGNARNCRKG